MEIKIFSRFISILLERILKHQFDLFTFFSHQRNVMKNEPISMLKIEKKIRKYTRKLGMQFVGYLNSFPFSLQIGDHFKRYLKINAHEEFQ